MRGPTAPVRLDQNEQRFLIGFRAPFIPELESIDARSLSGRPIEDLFGQQIAFLRAFASHDEGYPAVQMRFICERDEPRAVNLVLLGAASGARAAEALSHRILLGLSPGLHLEPLTETQIAETVNCFSAEGLSSDRVAEIRRTHQVLDPLRPPTMDNVMLVPWGWSADSLLLSLEAIRGQPGLSAIVIHIEQGDATPALREHMQRAMLALAQRRANEPENPLFLRAIASTSRAFLGLSRAALMLRLLVVSEEPLASGLPEFVGADLTRKADDTYSVALSFDVHRPGSRDDLEETRAILERLSAPRTSLDFGAAEDEIRDALSVLFDPREAHTAFRVPIAPRAGIAGMTSIRTPAFSVGLDPPGEDETVIIGVAQSGVRVGISTDELAQHVFIAGVPGSGKTTTVQTLLSRLWLGEGIPFLVLDPAKTDYRRLLGNLGDASLFLELGPGGAALNPLAVPTGVSIGAHAMRISAAFESAMPFSREFQFGGVLLRSAIVATYRSDGFEPTDVAPAGASWPTVVDLYQVMATRLRDDFGGSRDFAGLSGSMLGRLEALLQGTMGDAMSGGPTAAIDWGVLSSRPALVEMRQFAGADERALVFALLLGQLVSYREAHPGRGLVHLTVLEEAHRVLRHDPSGESDAARTFSDAIAELRAAGEGFVVVEQAPSLLIPAVAKNTGTRIAHRLLDAEERRTLADSMLLDDSQAGDLGRLGPGRAIVLTPSRTDPLLVAVDPLALGDLEPASASMPGTGGSPPTRLWCGPCLAKCIARQHRHLAERFLALGTEDPRDIARAALEHLWDEGVRDPELWAGGFCAAGATLARIHETRHAELDSALRAAQQFIQDNRRARARARQEAIDDQGQGGREG